jgi:hypothetical protein
LSPDRAAAECGGYVHIRNAPAAPEQHAPPATAEKPAPPTPLAPPCQGPNCSGAPDRHTPPSAPVSPVGPQAKDVVQCLGPIAGTDAPRAACDREDAESRPIHRPSSLFHPPRAG